MSKPLSQDDYYKATCLTPIASVDILIWSKDRTQLLMGLRNNNPAKNTWFVPGCAVYKNEKQIDACKRVLHQELGLSLDTLLDSDFHMNQVNDHIYSNNFRDDLHKTHYVCIAYEWRPDHLPKLIQPADLQHSVLQWIGYKQKDVFPIHPYTLHYFSNMK
jgi:colanic acid biosynthesis protein WcaH